jgi:hypothetical protein
MVAFGKHVRLLSGNFFTYGMILKPVLQPARMAEAYCLMMKAEAPPGRAESEADLPMVKEPSEGVSTPEKVEADFPEPELQDEEPWEKERRTQRWHEFKTP